MTLFHVNDCADCAKECPAECPHACHRNILLGTITDAEGRQVKIGADFDSVTIGDFKFTPESAFGMYFSEAVIIGLEWKMGGRTSVRVRVNEPAPEPPEEGAAPWN